MQAEELWLRALPLLKDRLSPRNFESWVKPSRAIAIEDSTLFIETPSEFAREWIHRNLLGDINRALSEAAEGNYTVSFRVAETGASAEESLQETANPEENAPARPKYGILIPKYTFDTFVVGNHNRFAHAATMAVAEKPSKAYNPLFIYGGVGLGKTHLMHAIAHYLLAARPNTQVAYLSSEKFTNEMINSIREKREEEFRRRYRSIDLLLIDDVQFLSGKVGTQEEFFHTFNALHEAGKQIVLSADRPPSEIAMLEARLRSRFEWGLITDIQPPDLETRIAILQSKAEADKMVVSDDVLTLIAASYQNNVRELEGAFIRVMAYASLTQSKVSLELAQSVLGQSIRKPITLERIREVIA
ncbi:MAG TPA: chromosomal replication initiator protein DnaA, partial [Chroococcales cyanobacterium]